MKGLNTQLSPFMALYENGLGPQISTFILVTGYINYMENTVKLSIQNQGR